MTWMNTDESYGRIAKMFHWVMAVLILGLLPVGLFMGGMENSPFKFEIYAFHKSFGLLVFFLGLARILWRFVSPAPDHLETHKYWEVTLAGAAHFWLYVCIIGMPLSGWLMSSAGEYPVPFFGIQMPALIGKNESMGELFYEVHEILGYTLMFVLALHVAGALKHHLFDRDDTLVRMTFVHKGALVSSAIVVLVGLSYGLSGMSVLQNFNKQETQQDVSQTIEQDPADKIDTSSLGEHEWAIVPESSKVSFEAVLYKAPFTAYFKNFSGKIVFNPDDLSTALADITLDMGQIQSGDAERDQTMGAADWFDTAAFPQSRFVTRSFEKGEGDSYVAIGDITIRGVTMPLIIPFQLQILDVKARMTATFSLDRGQFGVGQGQWQGEDTVGRTVNVSVDLTAVQ